MNKLTVGQIMLILEKHIYVDSRYDDEKGWIAGVESAAFEIFDLQHKHPETKQSEYDRGYEAGYNARAEGEECREA